MGRSAIARCIVGDHTKKMVAMSPCGCGQHGCWRSAPLLAAGWLACCWSVGSPNTACHAFFDANASQYCRLQATIYGATREPTCPRARCGWVSQPTQPFDVDRQPSPLIIDDLPINVHPAAQFQADLILHPLMFHTCHDQPLPLLRPHARPVLSPPPL